MTSFTTLYYTIINYTFFILNRFDKSLQLIVYTDGHCGMNCEHSWADAPVSGHLWEYCLCHEVADSSIYGGDGHLRGYKHAKSDRSAIDGTQTTNEDVEISSSKTNRKKFLQPQRLRFELTSTASSVVRDAATSAHNAMADLDLHVFGYEGKFQKLKKIKNVVNCVIYTRL